MYVASADGLNILAKEDEYQPQVGELRFDHYPTDDELASAFSGYAAAARNLDLRNQIYTLEKQQTERRVREAVAGVDGGWLANLNTQIINLRAQLT